MERKSGLTRGRILFAGMLKVIGSKNLGNYLKNKILLNTCSKTFEGKSNRSFDFTFKTLYLQNGHYNVIMRQPTTSTRLIKRNLHLTNNVIWRLLSFFTSHLNIQIKQRKKHRYTPNQTAHVLLLSSSKLIRWTIIGKRLSKTTDMTRTRTWGDLNTYH